MAQTARRPHQPPQLQGDQQDRARRFPGPHHPAGINNRAIRQANDQMAITVDNRGVY